MLQVFASLRRRIAAPIMAATLAVAPALGAAQELPQANSPVLVTSLGQSLDAYQVQLATKRTGAEVIYDALAGVDMLQDAQTLFLVVGASLKGFGEAGISIADERERARTLISEAEAGDIPVIVLHIGGADRRDDLTNQLIEVAAPSADAMFIRNDSDPDGMFQTISEENDIPLVTVENIVELVPELERLFGTTS